MTWLQCRVEFTNDLRVLMCYADGVGIQLVLDYARRSKEAQRILVSIGASKTMKSYHLNGLAVDFFIVENGKPVWNGDDPRYKKLGEFWESLRDGNVWGGRWDMSPKPGHQGDSGHFQGRKPI